MVRTHISGARVPTVSLSTDPDVTNLATLICVCRISLEEVNAISYKYKSIDGNFTVKRVMRVHLKVFNFKGSGQTTINCYTVPTISVVNRLVYICGICMEIVNTKCLNI